MEESSQESLVYGPYIKEYAQFSDFWCLIHLEFIFIYLTKFKLFLSFYVYNIYTTFY